jgi:uncharacterized protein (DUF433 family)
MNDFITSNPDILAGELIIKGTRISVAFVEECLLNKSYIEDIVKEFPQLTIEAVQFVSDELKLKTLIGIKEAFNKVSELNALTIDDFKTNELQASYIHVLSMVQEKIEYYELKTGKITIEELNRAAKTFALKCTHPIGNF